ncbi:glycerol-3-phosphate acyltransferase, chloroplastic-like isoform X1 [Panicum virgatum]|uniref:glycerol-3-phosphate acyltransferase, chloroplastic-like isoform X1 n=1 Tax=Panicum virgatum TaxID=38727 RepID=UPI0019D69538|nr:glycerol-3-phosphate acyltransferase, chloroplastic-like isoform X1 [Panicum virgatum]
MASLLLGRRETMAGAIGKGRIYGTTAQQRAVVHSCSITPSGGRDWPDPSTRELYPSPFDSSSVNNMRMLLEHAGLLGHIYPLSLLCYEVITSAGRERDW